MSFYCVSEVCYACISFYIMCADIILLCVFVTRCLFSVVLSLLCQRCVFCTFYVTGLCWFGLLFPVDFLYIMTVFTVHKGVCSFLDPCVLCADTFFVWCHSRYFFYCLFYVGGVLLISFFFMCSDCVILFLVCHWLYQRCVFILLVLTSWWVGCFLDVRGMYSLVLQFFYKLMIFLTVFFMTVLL